jgi:MHS family proline/betaine transporter-like MFS transporter
MARRMPSSLVVLYLSTFFLRLAFGSLLLLLAFYVPPTGGYPPIMGLPYFPLLGVAIIAVTYPLAEMLTAEPFGILSDRVGRRRVVVLGTTLAAGITALYSLSNDIWYLAILHGIHGIGAAATVAPAVAMVADYAGTKQRGRNMGWFDYSTLTGYIFGAVLGGFTHDLMGSQGGFLLVAGILATSALLLQLFAREAPLAADHKHPTLRDLRQLFRSRTVDFMFTVWLLLAVIIGLAVTYIPRIMSDRGYSGSKIGIFFAIGGAVLGLLQPFWGRLSDRFGRIPVMVYGVTSILGLILVLLVMPQEVERQTPWALALLALCGLGAGAFIPAALAMMADNAPAGEFGTTMGLYSFALGFGAFIAEASGLGIIVLGGDKGAPQGILYFAASLIFAAVFVTFLWLFRTLPHHFRLRFWRREPLTTKEK